MNNEECKMIEKKIKYFFCEELKLLENTLDEILFFLSNKNLKLENILFLTLFIKSNKFDFLEKRNLISKILLTRNFDIPFLVVAQLPFEADIAIELLWIEGNFDVLK